MQRRDVLKTAGITAGVGMLGAVSMTGSTVAQTTDSLNISDASATFVDGDATEVVVDMNATVTWTGFDVPVAAVAYRVGVEEVLAEGGGAAHTLHDNTATPILIANFSSKDAGGDGWGGPDEYASENPTEYVAATGPANEGYVHSAAVWTVLAESDSQAQSIENPAPIGEYSIDAGTDGETNTTTLRAVHELHFFKADEAGEITTQDGTPVSPMGGDGTLANAVATAEYDVSVTNEANAGDTTGSGTVSIN